MKESIGMEEKSRVWIGDYLIIYDLGRYLDYVAANKSKVIDRRDEVKELHCETPNYLSFTRMEYLTQIFDEYHRMRILFALSYPTSPFFHYPALDSSRKILELLIRFEQEINPEIRIKDIKSRIDELPWEKKIKDTAKFTYDLSCFSVHSRYHKVLGESSKNLNNEDTGNIDEFYKDMLEGLDEGWFKEHVREQMTKSKGIQKLDKFTLEVINRTVDLSNFVLIKYTNVVNHNK
jgi:hypothetical protein